MRPFSPAPKDLVRRWSRLGLGAIAAFSAVASLPATASASHTQLAIIQDGSDLSNPAAAFQEFRQLGANATRVVVPWFQIAPSANSTKKPNFNATDPNAYPANNWTTFDAIDRAAAADGITVDFTLSGGAPKWGEAKAPASPGANPLFLAWKPNAAAYGQWVKAMGTRYSGHFTPKGATTPLPAVHFWALFNEPNFGQDLGPQAINDSKVLTAPMYYRSLVNQGYTALKATGHARNTIVMGEFAAQGFEPGRFPKKTGGLPGNFGQTRPLLFIRQMYCVDNRFHELRGSAAKAVGCPTTAGASRRFRTQNPGLFNVSGLSIHPYGQSQSPVSKAGNAVDYGLFQDIPQIEATIDHVNRIYGSGKRLPIYNTEYGYITNPPSTHHRPRYVSPATGAYYINWGEYLSWKQSRVASYMQYLLTDPPPTAGPYAGFASGLEFPNGTHKPGYDAYRLPVYMPKTSISRNANAEIWGAARPAPFMKKDGAGTPTVAIQLNGTTLKTLNVTGAGGYFDIKMKFPKSGSVRLAYTYPATNPFLPTADLGKTVFSRSFNIKVR
ncbi:MAG TPA: hypothetical protein VHW96_17450 [Solirubrobacteraceae bacterium]|nr:hypothetical protein [Solirubrobacteraceae bacterium]